MEKLSSVFDFKNFYTKEACLVEAAILETDQKLNKKYALVRVFIDLTGKDQPYVIFINNKKGLVFIDLVSCLEPVEKIIEKHQTFFPEQPYFGTGTLKAQGKDIFLGEGQVADLASTILWAIDSETNLSPKIGLETVTEFLDPSC